VGADHAGVLQDRVVDGVLAAVGDLDAAATEAPRNGLRRPGAERGLADILEADDGKIAGPESAFLLMEALGDLLQRRRVIAGRQSALVTRAGHVKVQLKPVRSVGVSARQRRN